MYNRLCAECSQFADSRVCAVEVDFAFMITYLHD